MSGIPPYSIIEDIEVEPVIQNKWQKILDLIAGIINIPVALVMRVHAEEIEVFTKSSNKENIFCQTERARLNTGLYCEVVMASRRMLTIPNALQDEKWRQNPSVELGLIAYLGFPILWPDEEIFGTICILDTKERKFADQDIQLLGRFAEVLQDDLAAMIDRRKLKQENEEHLKYEAALRLSEERFRTIFHCLPSAVVITSSADGKIIDANESALAISGASREQVIGKTWPLLGITVSDEQRQALKKGLAAGRVTNYSLDLVTAAGETKNLLISIEGITVDGRECLLWMLTDLTSLSQLEQSLEQANERYGLAAEAAQLGVWDWDVKSKRILLDAQIAGIYGIGKAARATTYEEWLGFLHPEDTARCEAIIYGVLETCQAFDTEYRIIRPDGAVRYLKCYGKVVCNAEGEPMRMIGVNLDITEKKLADIALRQSEARLKRAQALAHVGNWEIDLETKQMWASMEAYRIYGIPYENGYIPLQNAQELVAAQDRPMMDRALVRLIRNDARYDVVFHIRRQNDGDPRTLHSIAECQRDADGQAVRVIGVVQDITDFSKAQDKIAESEAKYKALFKESSVVHLIIDAQTGHIIDANLAATSYYGYSQNVLIGKHIAELNTMTKQEAKEKLQGIYERRINRFETRHRISDGTLRDVEVFSGPMDLGKRQCVSSVIYDISTRKIAEDQLRESEGRFRMFVESAPDGVFVQINGCFAYVNEKTLQLFGAESEQDLIGKNILDSFSEEYRAKVKERIKTINEIREVLPPMEEAILRLDGSHLEVDVSSVPIRYNGQEGSLVFMRDITVRRAMEKEKHELQLQLQQKQRLESIGLLAGGVAHEVNNPLSGIINYAQLILEGPDEAIPAYSREIIHEGQRIAEIVRNLLKFSRHEKQSHSPAYIEDIVSETLSLIRTLMRHDQIALEVSIPPGLPSIKCRSQQIQQVLMNLLTNARDALNARYEGFHENKILRIDAELLERDGRRWIRVNIEDHGVGIPDEIRDKVFDPFFTTKPRGEGTGLGLSISHGIVKDHHGELYFATKPGQFTRAILELPVDNGWDLNGGTSHA